MILAVDIGNTSTVCGVFEEDKGLRAIFSFKTQECVSPEELLLKLKGFLELYSLTLRDIKGVCIACVVPPVLNWWIEVGKRWLVREVLVASAETVPIKIDLKYPAEVGADRLINALAAWEKYRSGLIIVDFGTATTFDCISEDGVYLGGAIAPGPGTSAEALFRKTAKLPRVELENPPESAIGKDTISAIKSGFVYGFASLTDGMIERLSKEMSSFTQAIATGGLASIIVPYCTKIKKVEPYLTLEGLYFLWKRVKP
ncbi:MAG: type III pantothenate kinase [Thermodesulfobacteria bacterium]|nr:type III pantothenate kinase [Thermodesulfobacteriota bacterium]